MVKMDIGLLYAIVAFVCAVIIGMILNRTTATKYKEMIDNTFRTVLIFFLVFCIVDGCWGTFFSTMLFEDKPWHDSGYEFFTYCFHGMSALSALFWSGYMIEYIHSSQRFAKALHVVRYGLLVTQWGILFANIRNHLAFSFPDGIYTPGPLRKSLFWIQFSYYLIIAICVAVVNIKRNEANRKLCQTAIIFSSIPLAAGILQLIYPDAPMYSLGFTLSSVVIYAFNVTAQREEYLSKFYATENSTLNDVILGLSEDYLFVTYIDLDTGAYTNFGRLDTRDGGSEGQDFFADELHDICRSIYPDDAPTVEQMLSREHIAAELSQKKSYRFNYRAIIDGTIKYHMMKVIRSGDGDANKIIIGVFDDDERIREQMAYQDELLAARNDAEQASRAKTNFLFNMSHDIRTPMNAILGFTDMTQKHIDDRPKALECIEKVHSAGKHLLSIINDVLDMSRIESGKIVIDESPMSLSKCTVEILDIVSGLAAEKHIELVRDGREITHDMVYCDRLHFERVCINVITNAIKYTPDGGNVYCRLVELPCDEAGVGRYSVIIRDTGVGMSPEFLEHIYEAFSRERSSTTSGVQGTGLGMAITKSLVELMNGEIDIESTQGVGTTVAINIPFRLADGVAAEEAPDSTEDITLLRGKRVLLVEDNALNREIACDLLAEDFGMVVDEADDGITAVEKCRSLADTPANERYDIIIMDIQMPIMDGYEAARTIRQLDGDYFANVPIVAMTANVFAEDIEKSHAAGMNAHLGKPIERTELIKVFSGFVQ